MTVGFGRRRILDAVTLQVEAGQTLVVLGESGCGKTTLLKALAGLLPVERGEIRLDEAPISHLPPAARNVIYLDQEPLLFEHLTAAENIGFALRLRKQPACEIARAVDGMLELLDLGDHRQKREWQLSGGQKQRVAFARAAMARPRLLLLDEPFCSLDGKTRGQMQSVFADLSQRHRLSSVFVTHDVKEALVVGHQFARMARGQVVAYPDRETFIRDEATGIPAEMEFWKSVDGVRSDR